MCAVLTCVVPLAEPHLPLLAARPAGGGWRWGPGAKRCGEQTMIRVFREVVENFVEAPAKLTHQQEVTRLYRQSLRILISWAFHRDHVNERAAAIRARFDAAKRLPANSGCVGRLAAGEGKGGTTGDGERALTHPPLPFSLSLPPTMAPLLTTER